MLNQTILYHIVGSICNKPSCGRCYITMNHTPAVLCVKSGTILGECARLNPWTPKTVMIEQSRATENVDLKKKSKMGFNYRDFNSSSSELFYFKPQMVFCSGGDSETTWCGRDTDLLTVPPRTQLWIKCFIGFQNVSITGSVVSVAILSEGTVLPPERLKAQIRSAFTSQHIASNPLTFIVNINTKLCVQFTATM